MGLSGTGNKTYIKMHQQGCCCWHFSGAQRAVGVGVWLDAMDSCGWRSVQPQLLRRNESLLSPSCSGHCDQKMFPICKGKVQSLPEALVPMHMIPQVGSFTGQDGWGFGIWDLLFWGVVWSHLVSTWYDSQAPGGPPMRRCFWSGSTPETAHLDWNVSGPHAFAANMVTDGPLLFPIIAVWIHRWKLGDFYPNIIRLYRSQWGDHRVRRISRLCRVWMLEDVGGVNKKTPSFLSFLFPGAAKSSSPRQGENI